MIFVKLETLDLLVKGRRWLRTSWKFCTCWWNQFKNRSVRSWHWNRRIRNWRRCKVVVTEKVLEVIFEVVSEEVSEKVSQVVSEVVSDILEEVP